jgi:hypothetical protein
MAIEVKPEEFQIPPIVCDYMSSFIPDCFHPLERDILEPTPGLGNLVRALELKGLVYTPPTGDFFEMEHKMRYDYVVMNPPFTPPTLAYKILYQCMDLSDNVIALLPWLVIINGQKRTKDLISFGLKSITHLPRKTFPGSRVQCCIIELKKGFQGDTIFKNFEF